MNPIQIGPCTLYLGDSREIMPWLDKVDHVITDPPYSERVHDGHNSLKGDDGADRSELGYEHLNDKQIAEYAALFRDASAGWIVWMHDHFMIPKICAALEKDRCVFAPLPFFQPGSRIRLTGDGPSCWTIWITVARTKELNKWGTLPGGYVAGAGWNDIVHMGGKPTLLMINLVKDYSREGETVLDPFMGSGTTGVACVRLGRKFIGIERDEKAFNVARKRLEREVSQNTLF